MGYYTDFTLDIQEKDRFGNELSALDVDLVEQEVEKMNVFESGNFGEGWYGNAKWYDRDADMILLSKRFPDMIFFLEGDGEDSDDRWGNYYCGGKVMYNGIELVYHPFDQNKLVSPVQQYHRNTYQYQQEVL